MAVKLHQELVRPRWGLDFVRPADSDTWQFHLPRPDADRIEYSLELVRRDGSSENVLDPGNPLRAPGPFGEKSVVELPPYEQPKWVYEDPEPGRVEPFEIKSRSIRARLSGLLWSCVGSDPSESLPVLVVHDGPEYAALTGLTKFLDLGVERGWLPRSRAALIAPVERNEIYSASAAYSRALVHEILPALDRIAPLPHGRKMRIGMGASLGALAMLNVHRRYPATFGALLFQSGSFFRYRWDKQESGLPRFRRIARFAGQVLAAQDWQHPIDIAMTCGTVEENLANNHAMSAALRSQGYRVRFTENRDAHNWTAWRDTFDPVLIELLQETWS